MTDYTAMSDTELACELAVRFGITALIDAEPAIDIEKDCLWVLDRMWEQHGASSMLQRAEGYACTYFLPGVQLSRWLDASRGRACAIASLQALDAIDRAAGEQTCARCEQVYPKGEEHECAK